MDNIQATGGRFPGTLHLYHRCFLGKLCAESVDFVVIGGQARAAYQSTATYDLDLLCRADDYCQLAKVLREWDQITGHIEGQFSFSETAQIHFPLADRLFIPRRLSSAYTSDDMIKIACEHGIDILGHIRLSDGTMLTYSDVINKSEYVSVDGFTVAILSEELCYLTQKPLQS